MARASSRILERFNAGRTDEPAKPAKFQQDVKMVEAVIAKADLPDFSKGIYRELLSSDTAMRSELVRTAAGELAQGLEQQGPKFLLNDSGELKDAFALGFTPFTIMGLADSARKKELAATLTSGPDLLETLQTKPETFKKLDDLSGAPLRVKQEYIQAIAATFDEGEKARRVLQETVNRVTGVGRVAKTDSDFDSGDPIDRGLSYIAKAMNLNTRRASYEDHHPVIHVLGLFVRTLPKGVDFDVRPPHNPSASKANADGPLSKTQQATAEDIKNFLFRGRGQDALKPGNAG